MNKFKSNIQKSPWVIALIYIIIGLFWIQFSDQLVLSLFDDPEKITQIQSKKGFFFVLTSGLIIFFLVKFSNNILQDVIEDLKLSNNKFKATIENAPVGIALHKPDEQWLEVNQAICDLFGYNREQLMQLNFSDSIHPDDIEEGRKMDRKLIDGEIKSYSSEKRYLRKDGAGFTGMIHKSVVYNENQKPLYLVAVLEDITRQKMQENQIRNSLKEKELLLSEIHHRVRNNLALISAFFDFENMYSNDQQVHRILNKNKKRIKCLALTHEAFSNNERSVNIRFGALLEELADFLQSTFPNEKKESNIRKNISPVELNINLAIPASLIVTELMINTIAENVDNLNEPLFNISLREQSNNVILQISDNGNGLLMKDDIDNPETLTFTIIEALISQLKGTIESHTDENGTEFSIRFAKRDLLGPGNSMSGIN